MPDFRGFQSLGPNEQSALVSAFGKQLREEAQQTNEWMVELARLAACIAGGSTASTSDYDMFWMRLQEFVTSIYETYTTRPAFLATNDTQRAIVEVTSILDRECSRARAVLSDDELIYIEIQRHRRGHVHQHKFHPSIKSGGKSIKDTARIGALGRTLSLAEIDSVVARVETKMGPAATDVAKSFSIRLAEPLAAFADALRRTYCYPA